MKKYCCGFMEQQLKHECDEHGPGRECPDVLVFRGSGGTFLEARNATYACRYCPYCGTPTAGRWSEGWRGVDGRFLAGEATTLSVWDDGRVTLSAAGEKNLLAVDRKKLIRFLQDVPLIQARIQQERREESDDAD